MPKLSSILLFLDKVKLLDLMMEFKPPSLVVIAYHNIGVSPSSQYKTFEEPLPPSLLEKHILYLLKKGYVVTSLEDALITLREKPPKKIAVLTFDDGYKGIYKYAYPVLRKYQVKATLYITAGFIKYRVVPWWEQLYYVVSKLRRTEDLYKLVQLLSKDKERSQKASGKQTIYVKSWIEKVVRSMDYPELENLIRTLSRELNISIPGDLYDATMLNPEEIKEIVEYGFEIGGHGLWHVNLTILNKDRLMEEVTKSLDFARALYKRVCTFAYPFGIYNDEVIKALVSAGFKAAATLNPQLNRLPIDNNYTISRISPYRFGLKSIASLKWSLVFS